MMHPEKRIFWVLLLGIVLAESGFYYCALNGLRFLPAI